MAVSKKKSKKLVINWPKELTETIHNYTFIYNNMKDFAKGMFWISPAKGKHLPLSDDNPFYAITRKNSIDNITIHNTSPGVHIDITLSELNRFVKKVNEDIKKPYAKKGNLVRHLSPDVGFVIRKGKK